MFAQTPQDTRRVVEFGRPDAMNPEERWVANMLTKPLTFLVGLASLVATAFVAAVGLGYAWICSPDLQTFPLYAAGPLVLAAGMAGLPVAWSRTRDNNAIVARLSLGLWIVFVIANVILMLSFALHVPPPAVQATAPHRAQPAARAPNLSEAEIERLDDEIRWRWYLVNDYGEELAAAKGARRERLLSAEDRRRYALAKTELEQFEIRRYGAPVVMKDLDPSRNGPGQLEIQGYASSEPAPAQAAMPATQGPWLGWAMISLVMIAFSAVGLLISAESLAAVMMAKVREGQARPVEELIPEAMPAPGMRVHAGEPSGGFSLWAGSCLSRSRTGEVRPAQAFTHYQTFCAANNVRMPLNQSRFYAEFSQYVGAAYGIAPAHSNGTVYRGVALFDDGEMDALNGHASPFNGHAGTFN